METSTDEKETTRLGLWRVALPAALALVAACTSPPQAYRPISDVKAIGSDGEPAAEYTLAVDTGESAVVQVWSRGTQWLEIDGQQRAVLGVVAEIENASSAPLDLEVTSLTIDRVHGIGTGEQGASIRSPRSTRARPREVRTLDLDYVLPQQIDTDDLRAFRITWSVSTASGHTVAANESTTFGPDLPITVTYPRAAGWDGWGCGPYGSVYAPIGYRRSIYRGPLFYHRGPSFGRGFRTCR